MSALQPTGQFQPAGQLEQSGRHPALPHPALPGPKADGHGDFGIPRAVLWGALGVIVFTVTVSAWARQNRLHAPQTATPAPLQQLAVRFEDRPDGSIGVLAADSGKVLNVVPPTSNGFIRGVLRGMFRTRKLEAQSLLQAEKANAERRTEIETQYRQRPFILAKYPERRLTLTDPGTDRRVELNSFGPTNTEAFEKLFEAALRANGH